MIHFVSFISWPVDVQVFVENHLLKRLTILH